MKCYIRRHTSWSNKFSDLFFSHFCISKFLNYFFLPLLHFSNLAFDFSILQFFHGSPLDFNICTYPWFDYGYQSLKSKFQYPSEDNFHCVCGNFINSNHKHYEWLCTSLSFHFQFLGLAQSSFGQWLFFKLDCNLDFLYQIGGDKKKNFKDVRVFCRFLKQALAVGSWLEDK